MVDVIKFHRYLLCGRADFIVTNTKTGNTLRYMFLGDGGSFGDNNYTLYCISINGQTAEQLGYGILGTMGDFYIEISANGLIYEFTPNRSLSVNVIETMAYKTFLYLLTNIKYPDIIHIRPVKYIL